VSKLLGEQRIPIKDRHLVPVLVDTTGPIAILSSVLGRADIVAHGHAGTTGTDVGVVQVDLSGIPIR
jgi:hypothetical protein